MLATSLYMILRGDEYNLAMLLRRIGGIYMLHLLTNSRAARLHQAQTSHSNLFHNLGRLEINNQNVWFSCFLGIRYYILIVLA